jgi:hypothetical protein
MGLKFEPVPGYSMPVVRVSNDAGGVIASLSFNPAGVPVNPPKHIGQQVLGLAWMAWLAAKK